MWTFFQSSGRIYRDGELIATGYAGRGDGKNNPAMQNVRQTGPLPQGKYTIGPAHTSAPLGPVVMNLEPDPANQMFGRSCFRIHGDDPIHMGQSSEGCIVLPRVFREEIAASPDRTLEVQA